MRGWLRRAERLEAIPEMADWVSPRLGIRFALEGIELALYRPDGRRFETFVELDQCYETERQRSCEEGLQQALERLVASGMA